MINELYELILNENGFIVKLRCNNKFDDDMYDKIIKLLNKLIVIWKEQKFVHIKAMIAIVELVDCLAGGNRFLNECETIKVEDAIIEIRDILNGLYEVI